MPLQRSISPFRHPPLLQPFHRDTFLATIQDGGPKVRYGGEGPGGGGGKLRVCLFHNPILNSKVGSHL